MTRIVRGEIYRLPAAPVGDPTLLRCYVIVSRKTLLDSKAGTVVCAPIDGNFEGLPTQVRVGAIEGLASGSCVNCDQLVSVDKSQLTDFMGTLPAPKLRELREALRAALDIE